MVKKPGQGQRAQVACHCGDGAAYGSQVLSTGGLRRKEANSRGHIAYIKAGEGSLGGAAVWRLPLAQGAILETRDRIPHGAPGAWSLLLPLPVSLPLSLSLSLCDYHK